MAHSQVENVDTVIVGNGPSALILSYILHGNVPFYSYPHADPSLHRPLSSRRNLLDIPLRALTALAGSLKYSTQALPINILLDTLLRPGGDTTVSPRSCIEWKIVSSAKVSHLVLGDAPKAGGQWAANPVEASSDIGTLSYAEQLTLPGYTIADHWKATKGRDLGELTRPTRAEVAEYYAAYPAAVGIEDTLRCDSSVRMVHRAGNGFVLSSQGRHIRCQHLVLASGVYTINNPAPPLLAPLYQLSTAWRGPILVVGSGFTAADIIMSTPPDRKILHIYNWDPEKNPSPLKACHPSAYPEYASIYMFMKAGAERLMNVSATASRHAGQKLIASSSSTLPSSMVKRNWNVNYEGLPNARIMSTGLEGDQLVPASEYASTAKYTADESGRRRSLFHHGPRRSSSTDESAKRSSSVDGNSPGTNIVPGRPNLGDKAATVRLGYSSIGDTIMRTVSGIHWVTGRSGSLSYLSNTLLQEVLPPEKRLSLQIDDHDAEMSRRASASQTSQGRSSLESAHGGSGAGAERRPSDSGVHDFATENKTKKATVTASTLRDKLEDPTSSLSPAAADVGRPESFGMMEVAKSVFVVGSLTGDSLVRFAYGSCCAVAGEIMRANGLEIEHGEPLPEHLAPVASSSSRRADSPEMRKTDPREAAQRQLAPDVAMGTVSNGYAAGGGGGGGADDPGAKQRGKRMMSRKAGKKDKCVVQ